MAMNQKVKLQRSDEDQIQSCNKRLRESYIIPASNEGSFRAMSHYAETLFIYVYADINYYI